MFYSTNVGLFAQATPKVDMSVLTNKLPASPTASELGKYGEVPVSLFNGIPQVNVPITQINGNDMSLPISLSYNASGVKVNQIASWVGLGFSLNAGGVITREIRDQPDDVKKFKPAILHCMYPCYNCVVCPSPNLNANLPIICDDCTDFLELKYDIDNTGYLYRGNTIEQFYTKEVNNYTSEERDIMFGRLWDTTHVRAAGFFDDNTKFNIGTVSKTIDGLSYQYYVLLKPQLEAFDTEADIFNFNFNGYAGQFMFDKNGVAKVLSNDDIKITYTLSETQDIMSEYSAIGMTSAFEGGITEFKVTTPDGALYVFNEKEITHSDSEGQNWGSSQFGFYKDCDPQLRRPYQTLRLKRRMAYTSWYLSKVYNPMGQVAFDLEYDKEVSIDHSSISQSKSGDNSTLQPYSKSSSVVTVFGKRLKKIKGYTIAEGTNVLTQSLEFDPLSTDRPDYYYPTWLTDKMGTTFSKTKALGKIIQKGENQSVTLKEFAFGYGTFTKILDSGCSTTPDYVNKHAERLKLLSVTETGKYNGDISKPAHSFEYDETPLPPRHSPHQDFWGFYNGPTKAQCLLPKLYAYRNYVQGTSNVENFQTIYSIFERPNGGSLNIDYFVLNPQTGNNLANDRNPDAAYSKAGILTKVTYPTGGNSTFEYEGHQFTMDNFITSYPVTEYSAGGLRIKSISNSVGIIKNYKYTKTVSGSERTTGKLVQLPNFGQSRFIQTPGVNLNSDLEKIIHSTTISSSSYFNTSNGNAYVGYEQVTETQTGNGKTVYYYNTPAMLGVKEHSENGTVLFKYPSVWRNLNPPYYDLGPFAPVPNYDWNRGLLLKKEVYEESNTTPLQITTNTYNLVKFEKIPSIKVQTVNSSPGTDWNPLNAVDVQALAKYYTLVADKRLATVTVKENYGSNSIESLTTYEYGNNHKNPIRTIVSNSDSKVYKTEVSYSKDLTTTTDPAIIKLNDYNIITPIETKLFVENVFQAGVRNIFENFTVGTKTMPLQKMWVEILKDNSLNEKAEVEIYNADGRVKQWKKSNYTTSEILTWKLGTGQIEQKAFGGLETKVTYHPNIRAVKTIMNENGQTSYFQYDPLLRLQTVQNKFDNSDPSVLSNPKVTATYSYNFGGTTAPNDNYVRTSTTFSDYSPTQTVKQCFDGLGRPIQGIKESYTPNYAHQKNQITYDAIGRQERSYQAFESSNSNFESVNLNSPRSTTPYTNVEYEHSPLNRAIKQYTEDGTFTSMEYDANTTDDKIWRFSIGTSANGYTIAPSTEYSVNQLSKTISWDENRTATDVYKGRTEIFKDKIGRAIMARKYVKDEYGTYKKVDTYTLYDDIGNTIVVIPPDVVNPTTGAVSDASLAFQYEYDKQNRMICKRVTGATKQDIYYDARDLVVLTQDGNQRLQNKLLATKYDALGRVIKTGFVSTSVTGTSRSSIESYALTNFTINTSEVLTETSYIPNRSLIQQTKARVLGYKKATDADFTIVNYEYDAYSRANGTTQTTHLNKYNSTFFPQNNADKPTQNFHSWVGPDNHYLVTLQYNNYDNGLRPTYTYHSIVLDNTWSNITPQRMVSYQKYDYKDQMIEKNLGGSIDWSTWSYRYLQSIDYTYNNRGWLTKINEGYLPQNSNAGPYPIMSCSAPWFCFGNRVYPNPGLHAGDMNPDLFAQELRYDNPEIGYPGNKPAQYNGNISQTSWQIAGRALQAYSFDYDGLDRLLEANYTDIGAEGWDCQTFTTDNKYREKLVYEDSRGNIKKITRNGLLESYDWGTGICGNFGQIDDLNFTYKSDSKNRVKNIADINSPAINPLVKHGFEPKANASDYQYDDNGNLIFDDHKGITNIEYNYLNLPVKITFTNNRSIEFIYDATGKKWRKTIKEAGQSTKERDYIDGVEYLTIGAVITPDIIHFTEGYAQRDPSTDGDWNWQGWMYKYALKDHLGNTRVTFSDRNNDGAVTTQDIEQINHYYPFGMNMEGPWNGAEGQLKYQFNGKEWNDKEFSDEFMGLGWNDFGARMYDPSIARWNTIDPMAEKMRFHSPYNYGFDNPVRFVDPDGQQGEDWVKGKDGKIYNDFSVTSKFEAWQKGVEYIGNNKLLVDKNTNAGYYLPFCSATAQCWGQIGEMATVTESRNPRHLREDNPDYLPYNPEAVGFQVSGSVDFLTSSYSVSFGVGLGPGQAGIFMTTGAGTGPFNLKSPLSGSLSASVFFADRTNIKQDKGLENLLNYGASVSGTAGVITGGYFQSSDRGTLKPTDGYRGINLGLSTPSGGIKTERTYTRGKIWKTN